MTAASIARVGQWLCRGGAALGALGLLGWLTGTGLGTMVVRGLPPMTPNTALGLLFIGSAAAARKRDNATRVQKTLSVLMALGVLALGTATLAEYTFGIDLQIDNVLIRHQPALSSVRPSPPTALALTLLAAALLFFDVRSTSRVSPSEWLALCAALTAFTGLTGIILRAEPLYRLTRAPLIGLSLPTSVSLLLTSIGMLFERPTAGIMRVATSPGPGGTLLRRLTLPTVVVPVVLGLVVTHLSAAYRIDNVSIPIAILAAALTAGGLAVLIATALPLDQEHAKLEASRAQTRILVEQAPDGIFVADLDGRYTDVNDAGCRMLGCLRKEILGKTIVDLLPPDDVERLWQTKATLLGGGIQVAEWRLRRKDGSYIPVEVSSSILPDGRWQAFVRDISERKRLEDALRLSDAKSTGIISISSDAIISVDEDQRITLFNEGAEKIFGYSKAEAIGASLDLLIPGRFHAAHRQHVAKFAATAGTGRRMGTRDGAIVGRRKNGEEFPADAAISALEVSGARVLTAVVRDVTEQKRIENEQRFLAEVGPALATTLDYEETLSRIAEIAVGRVSDFCIVDVVDDDGEIHRLRVVSHDPSHAWICDLLRPIPLDRRRPHLIRSALESRQPVFTQGPLVEDLEGVPGRGGHRRALDSLNLKSVMVIPLIARGKVLGAISFLSMTPSRVLGPEDLRLENELAQRAAVAVDNAKLYGAAQRAIQIRDDVLGVVAHDLRNPLAAILLETTVLQRNGPALDDRSRESVDAIKRSVIRTNRLIEDLLDVTRMEAGRLVIEQSRLPCAQVAADAVEIHRGLASSRGLELRLTLPGELPDIWADRDRLFQVFDNLIGNAIKFTPSGERITLGAEAREADVLFCVSDSGPGIAREDQPRLFDRFWQARATRRGGAGLGLPIVRGIVDAHCGHVWVESAPGSGSSFFFTIPRADHIERTSADAAPHAEILGATHEVDDRPRSPTAASFTASILKRG